MKYIDPKELIVPRAYFTEFDRITYSQVAWTKEDVHEIKLNLERKVKLLALIKGKVIIATSHLFESELAQEFMLTHPIVLEEGIVLPALISHYKDFTSFLNFKRDKSKEKENYLGKDKDEINSLLANSVDAVVKWDVQCASNWFKQRLIQDLKDERSVLRFKLTSVPTKQIIKIASQIAELDSASRGEIYKIAKNSGNDIFWKRFVEYTDFIYYLSGARAVNSEGVLPQENLIDFSLTDLANGKTKLSEYEIFYRIFLTIIKDWTQKIFPVEILDNLTFKDIVALRETLFYSGFVEKYNSLMEKTKQRVLVADTEQLIFTLEELFQFEEELHSIFKETVAHEHQFLKKMNKMKEGGKVLSSLVENFSLYGPLKSVLQISINILSFLGFRNQLHQVEKRTKQKFEKLQEFTTKGSFDNKIVLTKFLSEISKKYQSKLL